MTNVYTRSFAHMRRRSESVETPLTPAHELSSWLADDVCANCGAAVKGAQLYCSDACRTEDALKEDQTSDPRGQGRPSGEARRPEVQLASAMDMSRSAYVIPGATTSAGFGGRSQASAAATSSSAPALSKFGHAAYGIPSAAGPQERVAAAQSQVAHPTSPNLLAKYRASAALTSPALTALDKATTAPEVPDFAALSSSDESSSLPSKQRSTDGRRSSSRSTFSSASDAFSTVPSTPSPASAAAAVDDEELEELEPTDLVLPPSVGPAASMLLKGTKTRSASFVSGTIPSASLGNFHRSPGTTSIQHIPASSPKVHIANAPPAPSLGMHYSRRPSSTNMPAPVLFSAATAQSAAAPPAGPLSPRLLVARSPRSRKTATTTSSDDAHLSGAIPIDRRVSATTDEDASSSQQASAASSAAHTLRAFSPERLWHGRGNATPSPISGRPSIDGFRAALSRSSSDDAAHHSLSRRPSSSASPSGILHLFQGLPKPSSSAWPRSKSSSPVEDGPAIASRRPSLMRNHRRNNSAHGLGSDGNSASVLHGPRHLRMTPARQIRVAGNSADSDASDEPDAEDDDEDEDRRPGRRRTVAAHGISQDMEPSASLVHGRGGRASPSEARGRSTTRGPRSTSRRRSTSPKARIAAARRGASVSTESDAQPSEGKSEAPLDSGRAPYEPGAAPMPILARRESGAPGSIPDDTTLATRVEADVTAPSLSPVRGRGHRRDRAEPAAADSPSALASRLGSFSLADDAFVDSCEMAWAGYGHDDVATLRLKQSAAGKRLSLVTTPGVPHIAEAAAPGGTTADAGYDDVELDLE